MDERCGSACDTAAHFFRFITVVFCCCFFTCYAGSSRLVLVVVFSVVAQGLVKSSSVNDVLQAKEAGEMDQACVRLIVTTCLVANIPGMIREMKGVQINYHL